MTDFNDGAYGYKLPSSPPSAHFKVGIGDGDDLKVRVVKTGDNRWYPQPHKGYYYSGAQEHYLFAKEESMVMTYTDAQTLSSYSITGNTLPLSAITYYGPVFVENAATSTYLTRVYGTTKFYETITTWTQVGSTIWRADTPGTVFSARSNKYVVHSVPSSTVIDNDEYYYFDSSNNHIYTAGTTSPSSTFYVNYIIPITGTTNLLLQEIHRVDANNRIRAMYGDVASGDTTRLPIVRKVTYDSLVSWTVSASAVTGNLITLPSATFSKGDEVALSYYVRNSFVVSSGSIQLYSTLATAYTAYFEGTTEDYQDTSTIASSSDSYIQLNPLYSGVKNGFIYMAPLTAPVSRAYSLDVTCSPTRVAMISGTGSPVRVKAKVRDKDGNPVENLDMLYQFSSSYGYYNGMYPTNGKTDWNGEWVVNWAPTGVGTSAPLYIITVSGTTLSSSGAVAQITNRNLDYNVSTADVNKKLFLTVEDLEDGRVLLRAQIVRADGSSTPPPLGVGLVYFDMWRGSEKVDSTYSTVDDYGIASTYWAKSGGYTIIKASIADIDAGNQTIESNEVVVGG